MASWFVDKGQINDLDYMLLLLKKILIIIYFNSSLKKS